MPDEGVDQAGEDSKWVPRPPLSKNATGLIVVFTLFILFFAIMHLISQDDLVPKYEIIEDRQAVNQEEASALRAAEAMDLPEITGMSRYGSIFKDGYNETPDLPAKTEPRLIDGESIDYYKGLVLHYRREGSDVRVYVNYTADCTFVSSLNMTYHNESDWLELETDVQWRGTDYYNSIAQFKYQNLTGLEGADGQCSLEGAFIIIQALGYHEHWGPLAALWYGTRQLLVLDEDLVLRHAIVEVSPTIVA